MGNCQAAEAATVVIQHPGGRVERLYWPTPASEIMRSHPGHYVALITLCLPSEQRRQPDQHHRGGSTRVRLLRPKDTLLLGHVYRLVTSQDVMKGLQARKQEKMRAAQMDLLRKQRQQRQQRQQQTVTQLAADERGSVDPENDLQAVRQERGRQKAAPSAPRQRQWRPSLQSISEAGN